MNEEMHELNDYHKGYIDMMSKIYLKELKKMKKSELINELLNYKLFIDFNQSKNILDTINDDGEIDTTKYLLDADTGNLILSPNNDQIDSKQKCY